MAYGLFMLFCNCLIPGVMLLFGWIFRKHPPKQINSFYGYRTRRSSASQAAWDFAQVTMGKLWWRWGWVLLALSVAAQLPFLQAEESTISKISGLVCGAQVAVLLLSIWPVERALKRQFPDQSKNHQRKP